MTATQGVTGFDTQLKVATDVSPLNLKLVGECQDVKLNGETVDFAEFTHQQSPSGYREFKPTFKNPGEITCTFNWTSDAQQATLKTAFDASELLYFQILWPNSKTSTFTGYVANLGIDGSMAGALRKTLTIRITGAIVEA